MSYEDFEAESEKLREENDELLAAFTECLKETGIKQNTIKKHVQNVDFYINEYLLYDDCTSAKDGIPCLSGFFNWFFPKKAMWSSVASTKANVTSLKKFYLFLSEQKVINIIDYQVMLATIKNEMSDWLSHYSNEYEW
jgi:hypothetical protein